MQFKNKFAICVYGVRWKTSYTKIGKKKNFKCDQWAMTKNKNIDFQTLKRNIDVTKTSKTWLLFFHLPVPGDSRIFACTIPVLFQDLAIFVPCQDSCFNRGVRIDVFSSWLSRTFPVEYENHYKVFRYKKKK